MIFYSSFGCHVCVIRLEIRSNKIVDAITERALEQGNTEFFSDGQSITMKRNTQFLLLGKRYLNDRVTIANQISLFFANLPLLPYGNSLKMEVNLVNNYEKKAGAFDKLLLCDATGMSTKNEVINKLMRG